MMSVGVLLLSILMILAQSVFTPPIRYSTNNNQNQSISEIVNQDESAVVTIRGYKSLPSDSFFGFPSMIQATEGTGFVVNKDGTILTNKHVVPADETKYTIITSNGLKYKVDSIDRDPNNDIAVIKIDPSEHGDNQLNPVELGDSNNLEINSPVVGLGDDPGKIQPTMLSGVVSGIGDTIIASDAQNNNYERLHNLIQTNLKLVPGNSGSPLFDKTGKVVGINTATASGLENVSYAIPINAAKNFLNSLNK
jgi:serine protease Do